MLKQLVLDIERFPRTRVDESNLSNFLAVSLMSSLALLKFHLF